MATFVPDCGAPLVTRKGDSQPLDRAKAAKKKMLKMQKRSH
jgi:hypothetical protein